MSRVSCVIAFVMIVGLSPWSTDVALAQAVSTASVDGTVTDQTNAALPGVSVILTSPALQVGQREAVTDGEGRYRIVDLPVGTYTLQFSLDGFQTVRREGVQLTPNFAARINVPLNLGNLAETITVSGQSPIVDVTTTSGGTTLASDVVFSALPTAKTFTDIINLTPGMVTTNANTTRPGTLGLNGVVSRTAFGNATGALTTVDGQDLNSAVTPDFGTAQEIDVRTFGNAADVQGAGVQINMVMKSGGNDFHGRSQFLFMNDKLEGNNLTPSLKAQGLTIPQTLRYYTDVTTDLGGRLVRDRLWFYVALRDRRNQFGLPGFALNAGPDGKYLTGDEPPAYADTSEKHYVGKFSYQMTRKYQLVSTNLIERTYEDPSFNAGQGNGHFGGSARNTPYEASKFMDWPTNTINGEIRGTPTNRLLFSVQSGFSGYVVEYFPQRGSETLPPSYDRTTTLYTGANIATTTQTNNNPRKGTNKARAYNGSLTYMTPEFLGGSHAIKTGFKLSRPWGGDGRKNNPSGNFLQVFDTVGGVPHQPVELVTFNFPFFTDSRTETNAGYVTDRWTLGPRLTLNLGVRFDQFDLYYPEQTKPQGEFGGSGTFPRFEVGKWNSLVPRLAAAWDLTGSGRTVVKASYGVFNTSVSPGNFNKNSATTTTYRWQDANRNGRYDTGEINLDPNGPAFLSISTPANTIANPDLKSATATEATASIERELMANTSIRVLYLRRVSQNSSGTINPLRPYSAFTIPLTRRDPGADGIIGTSNDGPLVTIYDYDPAFRGADFVGNQAVNRPADREDSLNTLDMTFNRRATVRWGLMASFNVTKNHQWLTAIPQSPNEEYYPLDETWTWNYKLSGTYRLPGEVFVGAIYNGNRGDAGQRTYVFRAADPLGGPPLRQQGTVTLRLEPYGAQRGPAVRQLDLRAGKTFGLGAARRLELSIDALNALNSSSPYTTTYLSGPTFGDVVTYASPLTVRLGTVFSF